MSAALAGALTGCMGGDGNQPPAALPTAAPTSATPVPKPQPSSGSAYCTEVTQAIALRPAGGKLDAAAKTALARYAAALDRVVAVAPDGDREFWTATATLTRHAGRGGVKGDAAIATKAFARLPAATAHVQRECGIDIG
jgi:hypothetical protein